MQLSDEQNCIDALFGAVVAVKRIIAIGDASDP